MHQCRNTFRLQNVCGCIFHSWDKKVEINLFWVERRKWKKSSSHSNGEPLSHTHILYLVPFLSYACTHMHTHPHARTHALAPSVLCECEWREWRLAVSDIKRRLGRKKSLRWPIAKKKNLWLNFIFWAIHFRPNKIVSDRFLPKSLFFQLTWSGPVSS